MECKLERKTQPTATHPVPHHTATGQLASGTNELCRWLKPLRKAILQGMLATLPLGDSESNPRARGNRIRCNRLGQKRYRSKILQQICLENQLSSRMPGSQALRPCQGLPHMGWPTRAPVRSPTPVRIYPQFSLPGRVRPTGMYEVCQYTRMRAGNYVTNALSNMSALDELAASAPPTTPATEVSSTLAFRLAGRPPAPAGCLATRMHQRSMQHLQSEHTTDSTLRPSLATSFRQNQSGTLRKMECKLERNKTEPTATHHPPCAPSHSNWPTGIWDKRVTSYLFVGKRLMAVNYSSTEAKLASHRRFGGPGRHRWMRSSKIDDAQIRMI
jgi:hypothetical protein